MRKKYLRIHNRTLLSVLSIQHLRHVERLHLKMRKKYLRIHNWTILSVFSIQHLRHVERVHLNYFVCVQYPAPAARGPGAPELFCLCSVSSTCGTWSGCTLTILPVFSIQHLRHVDRVHLNYFVCVQYPAPVARGAGAPELFCLCSVSSTCGTWSGCT
jgi:hypothetical protein